MIYVTLYQCSKRENSTKQPDSSMPHLDLAININDDLSSVLRPRLRFTKPSSSQNQLYEFNYVYIPIFSRYYSIENWEYNADGTWTAYCVVDVLASWRLYITQSGGYVGRSSDTVKQNLNKTTRNIVDRFYPASAEFATIVDEMNTGLYVDPENTFYVVGVISADNPTLGAVKYFITSLSQLRIMISNLVNTSAESWTSVQGLTDDALKSLVNPIQYIVSCKWFPFGVLAIGSGSPIIRVYSWDTGARGVAITTTYTRWPDTGWKELTISDVTDHYIPGWTNGVVDDIHYYPYNAPYAQYSLITPWGIFEIDPDVVADYFHNQVDPSERPKIQWALTNVNLISGTAIFEVRMRNNARPNIGGDAYYTTLLRREVTLALDIPLAQATVDYVNMAKSTLEGGGRIGDVGAWMFNPVGNATAIASNILDAAVSAISPTVQSTSCGEATFTPVIEKMYFQQKRFKTVGQSNAMFGRPIKQPVDQIGNLNYGETERYMQMDYSNFKAPCTAEETDEVIRFLQTGFYLE